MGVINWINNLFKIHLKKYEAELAAHYTHPEQLQRDTLQQILRENAGTAIFKEHSLRADASPATYAERVPVRTYEEMQPYIHRILGNENQVLTRQKVSALAKTAATTQKTSKFLPVTREHILSCQKGSWFTLTSLHLHREDMQIFARKNMLIGGGAYGNYPGTNMLVADISALMIQSIPLILRTFYLPDIYTATLPNYEEKIRKIAKIAANEPSLTMLGGVPTWNLALYRQVLAEKNAKHLLEVWPNLQAYVHGGVSFAPYREHYEALIPSKDFLYHEIYNASEGYFAVQDQLDKDDMILILNNGIYYEFIPFDELQNDDRRAIPLEQVQPGTLYAMVITNSSGLYRYLLGDVVRFTSVHPYRIKIAGRTQEYINAFGEDLLLSNVQQALLTTCAEFEVKIKDYTIAPYYMKVNQKGRHQWFIEFAGEVPPLATFTEALDEAMKACNSNYAQKRTNDFAITKLEIIPLPTGFFQYWLRDRGKVGGQAKVPKLANHRQFAEDILDRLKKQTQTQKTEQ